MALVQIGKLDSAKEACLAELKPQPEHSGAKRLFERIEKTINEYEKSNNKVTKVQVRPSDHGMASESIQIGDTKQKRTGIIVFGHSRPLLLRNLLEALRRQSTTNDIHVWLDGHHGRPSCIEPVTICRELVQKEFPDVHLTAMNGNVGIEKLMIDGLSFMSSRYDRIIVLEDDCFPTADAIAEFEQALDEIATRSEVYSVYGHHFLTESEGETITRFQGWGWATTREKLLPVLAEIKRCFAMPELEYLQWARENMTPNVIKRLDVTPGRNCIKVASSFFCWDACTCVVTAVRQLVHKKTTKRVIYNCGMGDGSTHFPENDKFRQPPFNMISPNEVWDYYDAASGHPASSQVVVPLIPLRMTSSGTETQTRQTRVSTSSNSPRTNVIMAEKQKAVERTGSQGENLIFLISQPRGGSTLLQRILGGHPEIHTVAEPWIMLHPLYALKQEGITTEYLSYRAYEGLDDFLTDIPEGQELYITALREMALILYNRMRELSGKRFFLDKTPRYYYIIPELHRVFPKANFIILLRNPMAVLSSILSTWMKNRPGLLLKNAHYSDVTKGPRYLIDGIKQLKEDAIVVHYEELVTKPKDVVQHLCDRTGIPFYKDMLEYGLREPPKGRFGDPIGVHKHSRPVSDYIDKWVQNLVSPDLIEFAREYLSTLGTDVFSQMGYSYEETKNKLESKALPDRAEQVSPVPSLPQPSASNSTKRDRFIGEAVSVSHRYLISAIVSTYNSERFIRGCLEDLENQTIANRLEIIVVNSGSQQNEEAIIKEFQKKYNNIKYIKTEQRETIYRAWNRAIKAASGKYITNANTDDRHRQDAFEIMAKALDENPDKVLAYARYNGITEIYGQRVCYYESPTKPYSYKDLLRAECLIGPQPMWRKSVHEEFGYFDEDFISSGDIEFWLRLSQRHTFLYIDEILGDFLERPDSICHENARSISFLETMITYKCYWSAFKNSIVIGKKGIGGNKNPLISDWYAINLWRKKFREKFAEQSPEPIENVCELRNVGRAPSVSVIIVTHNRKTELKQNLLALSNQTEKNFEVIIGDNGQKYLNATELANAGPDELCYIKMRENLGPALARNKAVEFAKAPIVAFIDDDAVAADNWIEKILYNFKEYQIFALRGKISRKCNKMDVSDYYDLGPKSIPSMCEVPGNSAFRKDIFIKLGGFDSDLFACEGVALAYRIYEMLDGSISGVSYAPDVNVRHDPCDKSNPNYVYQETQQLILEKLLKIRYHNIEPYVACIQSLYPSNEDNFQGSFSKALDISLVIRKDYPGLAAEWAKRAVDMEPLSVKACFILGSLYTQLRMFNKAVTMLERVLTLLPEGLQAFYSDKSHTGRKNWANLADCYLSAATKLAVCFMQLREYGKVKTVYSHLLDYPYLKLTSEQRNSFQSILTKLKNVEATVIGDGMDDVPAEAFGDKTAGSQSRTNRADVIQVTDDETNYQYMVSAIVSTYNAERFLRGCLDDLERQTIADKLEIIVVNSGSQQNEEAIVRKYQQKHNNIVYLKTEQREGIYAAWNRAVKVARGTFLTNANTDDRHCRDALEIMARTLQASPDIALVYGDQICTDTPNGTFENHHAIEMAKRPDYSRERLLFGCCVGSQPMWRKSLHKEFGYFDETLTCAGDWDFWLRISSKYKFKHIPQFLGLYYYNKNGIEHGRKIHSLYERYIVGRRYGNPYISVIPLYKSHDNPLVSVIMPAYNAGQYIAEAIESVLIQNYRNFELIIVDDGSTDDTKAIVTGFKDDRIKYFYKENGGPSSARNHAIKQAKGQYIMPLDADDMMVPNFIISHLKEFEKNPEADLVYSDVLLIDEVGNPIKVMNKPEYQDRRHLIRDLFRRGHPIVPFRLGLRRSVFDKIGLYDETLMVAEDYDMMRRFVKAGLKAHHLSEALHIRRMRSDNISRTVNVHKAKNHFDVVKRFTDTFRYDELFPDVAWDKIRPEMRQLHAKCLAAVNCVAIGRTYVEANSPIYAKTAFELACSELNNCVRMDPNNSQLHQLLQQCESVRARYEKTLPQTVC
jgi:glycosyltransferase involved in cell wall biosynthesis